MSHGVVPEGFNAKDLETLLSEIEESQRSDIDAAINTQADSVLGQLNGIFGDKLAEIWEVCLATYRARQPDSATGEALDNVAAITGAIRLPAAPSVAAAYLNLDPAVSLPIGTLVSIGAAGAQWETQTVLTNGGAFQESLPVVVASVDAAPIVGNAYSIDTIVNPIAGWSAKAAFDSLNAEPFVLADFQTLQIQIDGGPTQNVVFNAGDFANIAAATAQEVIDAIKADTVGLDGLDVGGFLRLFSELDGSGSAIRVVGGSGFEALGLSQELIQGFNPSRSAKIINAINETYDLSGSPTLFIAIDGAGSQAINFVDSDFGTAARGRLTNIAASLLAPGVDTDTFILDDGVNPAVTFVFDDDASIVETPTLRAIVHNGTQTANQIRDLVVSAINAAPTLAITAAPDPLVSSVAELVNDATGPAGNVAIVETVSNAGFIATGMAGGVADTPAVATALQVAQAINRTLVGGVAYVVSGKVQIESLVVGDNSEVEITGGSANTELGYPLSEPVGGFNADAVLGRDIETDAEFRTRREDLLQLSGSATVEAIRSAILNTPGVTQAFVFENPTDFVDGDGRPPHSMEAIVSGGLDEAIAQAIFDTKPIGIQTYAVPGPSGVSVIITDSQGTDHTINFSRAEDITMHVEVDINVIATEFGGGNQVNGEQEVREAIKALGDLQNIGQDIIILRYKCVPLDIAGVDDVTDIYIEDTDPPLNQANISFTARQLPKFSTANIDINVNFV